MRFVPPAAALADGPVAFDGDARARERPLATVLDALRALGARVDGDGPAVHPARHRRAPGGDVVIDASASSQFVSGLLLSGARYDKGVTVHHDGKPVPSLPHIEMTVAMLREADVDVDDAEPNTWRVATGRHPGPRLGGRARSLQRRGLPRCGGRHRRPGHGRGLARRLDAARHRDPGRAGRGGLHGRSPAPTG